MPSNLRDLLRRARYYVALYVPAEGPDESQDWAQQLVLLRDIDRVLHQKPARRPEKE